MRPWMPSPALATTRTRVLFRAAGRRSDERDRAPSPDTATLQQCSSGGSPGATGSSAPAVVGDMRGVGEAVPSLSRVRWWRRRDTGRLAATVGVDVGARDVARLGRRQPHRYVTVGQNRGCRAQTDHAGDVHDGPAVALLHVVVGALRHVEGGQEVEGDDALRETRRHRGRVGRRGSTGVAITFLSIAVAGAGRTEMTL
jgi:hypothetical protein